MSTRNEITDLYKLVIDDVMLKLQNDFENMGIDEGVLFELQETWESKLIETKALGTTEVEIPIVNPLEGQITQLDGPLDDTVEDINGKDTYYEYEDEDVKKNEEKPIKHDAESDSDSQGVKDDYFDKEPIEHNKEDSTKMNDDQEKSSVKQPDDLGSDLDSDNDSQKSTISDTKALQTLQNNFILCQYEKVSRTRNKWKCVLRDGIVHIDDYDYAFNRATAEFEWW